MSAFKEKIAYIPGSIEQGGQKIAVLGGDDRENPLINYLLNANYEVAIWARDPQNLPEGSIFCQKAEEAFYGAQAVILPMPGVKNDGKLYSKSCGDCYLTERDFGVLPEGTLILVGAASDFLKKTAEKYGLKLLPMVETDQIAIPNAIPTAEGAISLAIANSPIVLQDAKGIVLGFGRVGQALAPRLRALGMQVTISNRGSGRANLALQEGYSLLSWDQWQNMVVDADYIFNTIPVKRPLLTASVLNNMKKTALILDLASAPGGTDFAAAKEKGITAILASGLPGKYASQTAGEILTKVYPQILAEHFSQKEEQIAVNDNILEIRKRK
ncbi:MAG: dipicolinate synthase subunit DpsA [Clostridiales bacterium]